MGDSIETLQAEPTPPSFELAEEAILTTHRILEAFGRDRRTFDILHADLFDSRPAVALSALQAVTTIADHGSFVYAARLFSHPDPLIVCAAARAAGVIGGPEGLPLLLSLSTSARDESVRLEVLRALARSFPDAAETRQLALSLSLSVAVQQETRTAALEVLVQIQDLREGGSHFDPAAQNPAVLPFLFHEARKDTILAQALFAAYEKKHAGLPVSLREALVSLAAPFTSEPGRAIFVESLRAEHPGVRRECYRHLGAHPGQVPHFDALCAGLVDMVEDDPSMEEEALQAIDAMESALRTAESAPPLPSLAGLAAGIRKLFDELRPATETNIDTGYELGQQIANAKEYLEFNFNEDAKKAFVQSIRSEGSPQLRRESARILQDSAVCLEPRHIDGYKTMYSLLADPGRPAIVVFIRNLAYADTGKRSLLRRLKRSLSLARLAPREGSSELFLSILEWARKMRLFRLAECALFALHRVDPGSALEKCREFMTPPVANKFLAIGALDLLGEMDLAAIEPVINGLLHENDRYIRLSLLESLASLEALPGVNLQRALLQLFCVEADAETVSKLMDNLGTKGDALVARALIEVYERLSDWKKPLSITLLARIAPRAGPENKPVLTEFLYRVLRIGSPSVLARVPSALLALGDDYAPTVVRDILPRMGPAEQATLVRDLRDFLRPGIIAAIWTLLREKDRGLHQALREILPGTSDPRAQQLLASMVRALRVKSGEIEPHETKAGMEQAALISSEKETYRFEREHTRVCSVLFTDIQDYSVRAQEISSLELGALLQEYEGILLPVLSAHEGELVKRMGDGHLFVLRDPLNAVLAAIRLQKALRRYNRFHPPKQRVQVRIGIHWGEVVERSGDVLGNTVNIASRLQSAATGGSTCISHEVYAKVAEWIHANDLGLIQVKGIRDPIRAWEPTEAAMGMPPDLDPLKRAGRREPAARADAFDAAAPRPEIEALSTTLSQAFEHLRAVSRKSARSGEEAIIDEEFLKTWESLRPLLPSTQKGDERRQPQDPQKA